ncbi:MAG: RagB/SusD family nutrient uptake outer membrane protein [Bacteroidales bacterium]|nr:MAG: RagB/SusD family nutrient uptake outer membrane protein [Bacteroidales bacterium]
MKKINFILITLVLIFSGCTEFLTLEPQDELIREEYWKTETDVVNVLGQAYAKMADILDDVYYWTELRGGLLSPNENRVKPETLEFFNFNINEFNEKTKWKDFYVLINLVNTIIEYAPLAKDNDKTFTDIAYNGYIAEAYYIRCLCYFYLVKSFKDVPYITKSYSMDDQDFNFAKSSEQEIIDYLITDLNSIVDKAFNLDYYDPEDTRRKGRVNVNTVYALLADIYLWNDNYQSCIESCNKVNELSYELVPGDDYFDIFAEEGNSSESIFELQFDYDEYQTTNKFLDHENKDGDNLYSLTSNNSQGKKETEVSEYLMELYATDDLRQYSDEGDVTYNSSVLSIWKYEGNAPYDQSIRNRNDRDKEESDANWIFYRFSEIHLMKAEAYAEMDDFTKSLEQLNIVRKRAGIVDYTTENRKILIEEILNERAREFVGEGKRWFDLVRVCRRDIDNRLPIISGAVISNVDPRSRSAVAIKLRDTNSWFLPVFYIELQLNSQLEQNPFYE